MPLIIVSVAEEKIVDMFIDMSKISWGHSLEGFRGNTSEPRSFGILEFFHCLAKFIPGDGIVEFPKSPTLGNLVKESCIGGSVSIEHSVEMG